MSLFEPIIVALNATRVRYVVVGGLATVLHGHARLTADIDLVVDLAPNEAMKVIEALLGLGFRARVPVDARLFADPAARQGWIAEKGMQVFTMIDTTNPMRSVDLFVEAPIAFDELWGRAEVVSLATTEVRIAAISDLIRMKRLAARPQDAIDIEALEHIQRRKVDDGRRR